MLFYGYYRKDFITHPIHLLTKLPPVIIIKASSFVNANMILARYNFEDKIDLIRMDNNETRNKEII